VFPGLLLGRRDRCDEIEPRRIVTYAGLDEEGQTFGIPMVRMLFWNMSTRAILWDFDGTLATRPGLWSSCVVEVLDQGQPDHGASRAEVARYLESGFPWHDWDTVHDHVRDADGWWEPVLALIAEAMMRVGISSESAPALAAQFRPCFLDPTRWQVYPDSAKALRLSAAEGWRNIIVSNHVPELPELVARLGLDDQVHAVMTSAAHGHEKPHPGAFRLALEAAGAPTAVWMIGDNPIADIAGAARVGIPGVLIRAPDFDPIYVRRLESSFGASHFPDWQTHCELRAETALQAVNLILSKTA
jgi:putative hydrolase of the HAD superfamily